MDEADRNRLYDMLNAARKAQHFVAGKEREILDEDEILALAVTRLLEIVGEAARSVSEETRQELPELPWPAIIGMRHRIAHDYLPPVNLDKLIAIQLNSPLPYHD